MSWITGFKIGTEDIVSYWMKDYLTFDPYSTMCYRNSLF